MTNEGQLIMLQPAYSDMKELFQQVLSKIGGYKLDELTKIEILKGKIILHKKPETLANVL